MEIITKIVVYVYFLEKNYSVTGIRMQGSTDGEAGRVSPAR